MTEYHYHCQYCNDRWSGIYRVNDPVCRKCGSEGDYYVKTSKVEKGDLYYGEEQRHSVRRSDSDR